LKYLIDFFLLWKCLPVLLRHFKLMPPVTVQTDSKGDPWDSSVENYDGAEPTYVAVRPTTEEVTAAGIGAAYGLYNLLNGGR
jgi:hypothetical protein